MRRYIKKCLCIYFCLYICFSAMFQTSTLAESIDFEDPYHLLEKSLNVAELEYEITRLDQLQIDVQETLASTEILMEEQLHYVEIKKKHAATVLRAYYMGERNALWLYLFSVDSLTTALALFEYIQLILEQDRHHLHAYEQAYRELQTYSEQLTTYEAELNDTKKQLEQRHANLTTVQSEIDDTLSILSDEERAAQIQEMIQFIAQWETTGKPLFNEYMNSLATAMQDFPELLSEDGVIQTKGKKLLFQLTSEQLQQFLMKKNNIFRDLQITFEEKYLKIVGEKGQIQVVIEGEYFLERPPTKTINFKINSLQFNGLPLPDLTKRELERQYDLSFNIDLLELRLKASQLTIEPGVLTVEIVIH